MAALSVDTLWRQQATRAGTVGKTNGLRYLLKALLCRHRNPVGGLKLFLFLSYLLAGAGLGGGVCLVVFHPALFTAYLLKQYLIFAVLVVATVTAIVGRHLSLLGRGHFLAIVLLLAVGDSFCAFWGFVPTVRRGGTAPYSGATAFLISDRDRFRVLGMGRCLIPNTHMLYDMSEIRGFDGLGIRQYRKVQSLIGDFQGSWRKIDPQDLKNTRLLDLLNVQYIITPPHDQGLEHLAEAGRLELVYDDDARIYLNKSFLPRAFLVDESITAVGQRALEILDSDLLD